MPEPLFKHALVPVASQADTEATMQAVLPYLAAAAGDVTVVHVMDEAGDTPDEASAKQREEAAREMFAIAREETGDANVTLTTEIRHGTDVGATIIDAANDLDASAIVFTPRESNRWRRLLTGDVAVSLVAKSNIPVLTLPNTERSGEP